MGEAVEVIPEVLTIRFDGKGHASGIDPDEFSGLELDEGSEDFAWQHLKLGAPQTAELLRKSDLDSFVIDALTAEETRPRCTVHETGVILNLRGVNLHPNQPPEDMISVRFWITAKKVIGIWRRPLYAVSDLLAAIDRDQAPVSPGDLVARLALRLADRAEPAIAELNEQVDALEESLIEPDAEISRSDLATVRRMSIVLRRYLMPQRDALTTLEIEDLPWLQERDRSRLREAAERIYRLGEDLDAIRDRTQIVHDQIMDKRAERLNDRMLLLSVVAAIFLPLGLITGLLGINVGGVPGQGSPMAFWIVSGIIVALGALLAILAKRGGMMR